MNDSQWIHSWLARVSSFLDQQNASAKPNRHAHLIFRPSEGESKQLTKIAVRYPALANELTRFLGAANSCYLSWLDGKADWSVFLQYIFDLKTQLVTAVEALDGPLESPPPELLAQLRGKRGSLLCDLWNRSGITLADLAELRWSVNPDPETARRAVNNLMNALASLGQPDLVAVKNSRVLICRK